jgi:hypothetical protein
MRRHGHKADLPTNHAAEAAMAAFGRALLDESVFKQDFNEFPKRAFQPWQVTGNPTVESLSRLLPEIVSVKKRNAHLKRTKKGARRFSNCERAGSVSARAA